MYGLEWKLNYSEEVAGEDMLTRDVRLTQGLFFQSSLTSAWPEPRRGGGPSAWEALKWRMKVCVKPGAAWPVLSVVVT